MDRTGRTQKTPGRHGIRKRLTGLFLLIGVPLTAGLISARIADIPGASDVMKQAYVTYCDEAKH